MLKKGEKHDILYLELRWDIMNNNLLIGTAMLILLCYFQTLAAII